MSDEFSELSNKLTKEFSSETKKNEGIFFTHPKIVKRIVDYLKTTRHLKFTDIKILEPSCGSGEFIDYIDKKIRKKTIHAIELNKKIYDEVSQKDYSDAVEFFNQDYLQYNTDDKYNLIVGNPPYFVIPKKKVPEKYKEYITGRPNIFCLFILHSLYKLENDGILVFVLPNSFMNSSYYEQVRKLISEKYYLYKIMNFKTDPLFKDTLQATSAFFIKNTSPKRKKYIHKFNNITLFTDQKKLFQNLVKNTKTLTELGFIVKNGDTVWNQLKDKMSNNNEDMLLIYTDNIKTGKFEFSTFKTPKKEQYIKTDRTGNTEPCIIISRGYGNATYAFNYALLDIDKPYLHENHIIGIFYKNPESTRDEKIEKLNKIIESFNDPKTKEFIENFSGNNALNTTEIKSILPIYDF